jgi:hypothetical protein
MRRFHHQLLVALLLILLPIAYSGQVATAHPIPDDQNEPLVVPIMAPAISRAALAKLCTSNQPIKAAPAYKAGPGLHPAVILKETGGIHLFNAARELRGLVSWTPQLAYCLSNPVKERANNCYWYRKETTGEWTKMQDLDADGKAPLGEYPTIHVRVIAVRTGQIVDAFKLDGEYISKDPQFCVPKKGKLPQASPITARQFAIQVKTLVVQK